MNYFSEISKNKLSTCDENLQKVFNEAIKECPIDFSISYGHRTPEEQNKLFKQGRSVPGRIVTYCDGYEKKSKHNYLPSQAVDIVCFKNHKVTWEPEYYKRVAIHVLKVATELGIKITWGGNFSKLQDLPHFQI
jgi:peptidoglycan L-alanyl-D-glutamate endopeptidase CwlK